MPDQTQPQSTAGGTIAYILKGFPRLSETFITSEIYRMEQLGLKLKLYVIKPSESDVSRAGIVQYIAAKPFYLPGTTSLKETPLFRWLSLHLLDFSPSLRKMFFADPWRVAKALLRLWRRRSAHDAASGRRRARFISRNFYRQP